MKKVFVYGSLKKNFQNHSLLKESKFIGNAEISGYKMYNIGYFPGIVKSDAKDVVKGEIYEINMDVETRLDYLECIPDLYRKEYVNTEFGVCIVYVYNRDISMCNPVNSGEWTIDELNNMFY